MFSKVLMPSFRTAVILILVLLAELFVSAFVLVDYVGIHYGTPLETQWMAIFTFAAAIQICSVMYLSTRRNKDRILHPKRESEPSTQGIHKENGDGLILQPQTIQNRVA